MSNYWMHRPLTDRERARVAKLYWHYGLDYAAIYKRTGFRYDQIKQAVNAAASAADARPTPRR